MDAWYCAPKARSHAFTLLPSNADESVKLDAAGNAKAAELVRQKSQKGPLYVTIDGTRVNDTLAVKSIAAAR